MREFFESLEQRSSWIGEHVAVCACSVCHGERRPRLLGAPRPGLLQPATIITALGDPRAVVARQGERRTADEIGSLSSPENFELVEVDGGPVFA